MNILEDLSSHERNDKIHTDTKTRRNQTGGDAVYIRLRHGL